MPIKLKKNWFIIAFSIVLFLINVGIARADLVITVKYNDGCYVQGAFVEVWEDMGTNEVCAGWTNIYGKFICPTSSLNEHGCPPKTKYWVQIFKPDDEERWFREAYVDGACYGVADATLPVSCLSMEGKQCDSQTFTCDNTPPQWSNITTNPKNPAVYKSGATYNFSIDWADNVLVDEIIFEIDGVDNYSSKSGYVNNTVGNTYNISFPACPSSGSGGGGGRMPVLCSMDPITSLTEIVKILVDKFLSGGIARAADPCLDARTYSYKWYAKDNSGNQNSTGPLSYRIDITDPIIVTIISPESKTYTSNSVDLTYTVSSPFEISWTGYSLDNKPNITLEGNTILTGLSEGSHNVIVYANTTYAVMNSSQRVYFAVSLPKPDLIIEDIWTSGNSIYYKIKNQGNANAGYSYSNLYVDGYYKKNDYVPLLASLSSSNEYFSYSWFCSGTSDTIKVCADANGNVIESNENNNCLTKTFTCPIQTCTCTAWEPTFTCCSYSKEKWTRICTPRGCQAESKCEGFCFI